jgi:hypothetical protein
MAKKRVRVNQSKNIENAIMEEILKEINGEVRERKRAKLTGRCSTYGVMNDVIKKHKIANPWLNRDKLNNYKRSKAHKKKQVTIVTPISDSISSVTMDSNIPSSANEESDPTTSASTIAPSTSDVAKVNKGGRPKGSTNESIRALKRTEKLALNYASHECFNVRQVFMSNGAERIPKGTYDDIIKKAEEKFSLKEGTINKQTMLTRLKRGNLSATGRGLDSPMIALEAHFLDLILELAAMRQPVTATDAINLINSMITTSNLSEDIIEWKKKHLPGEFEDDKAGRLGKKYWRNFKKRHPEIKQKKAVRFDANREDWCNVENFQTMYDHVYAAMVKSKVAIELEEEVMLRLDGTITENEEESTGRKTKYILTHPELVLFVDEVGSNTSQRSDGNIGGQKFIVHQAQRALL